MRKIIEKIKKLKKIKPFRKKPKNSSNKVWKKLSLELARKIYEEECKNAQENY
jgi:hypothetical protein